MSAGTRLTCLPITCCATMRILPMLPQPFMQDRDQAGGNEADANFFGGKTLAMVRDDLRRWMRGSCTKAYDLFSNADTTYPLTLSGTALLRGRLVACMLLQGDDALPEYLDLLYDLLAFAVAVGDTDQ